MILIMVPVLLLGRIVVEQHRQIVTILVQVRVLVVRSNILFGPFQVASKTRLRWFGEHRSVGQGSLHFVRRSVGPVVHFASGVDSTTYMQSFSHESWMLFPQHWLRPGACNGP